MSTNLMHIVKLEVEKLLTLAIWMMNRTLKYTKKRKFPTSKYTMRHYMHPKNPKKILQKGDAVILPKQNLRSL